MIKINAELKNVTFEMKELEFNDSCTNETLCVISSIIDIMEKEEEISRKKILKMIKYFDKKWVTFNEEKNDDEIEEI